MLRLTETEERNKERNHSFQQRVFFSAFLSDLFGRIIIEVTVLCSELLENWVIKFVS
jgi:hypothetical protein